MSDRLLNGIDRLQMACTARSYSCLLKLMRLRPQLPSAGRVRGCGMLFYEPSATASAYPSLYSLLHISGNVYWQVEALQAVTAGTQTCHADSAVH